MTNTKKRLDAEWMENQQGNRGVTSVIWFSKLSKNVKSKNVPTLYKINKNVWSVPWVSFFIVLKKRSYIAPLCIWFFLMGTNTFYWLYTEINVGYHRNWSSYHNKTLIQQRLGLVVHFLNFHFSFYKVIDFLK